MKPETFNEWRIFPRAASILFGYMAWRTLEWYMLLPDPNTEQAAMVTMLLPCVVGWFKFYVESGKND